MELVIEGEYRRTINISGMGEAYEETCQRMLWMGLRKLNIWPTTIWDTTEQNSHIVGVLITKDPLLKELESEWQSDSEIHQYGTSGAQHQAVMNHLAWIHNHSYREWIDEIEKVEPDRTYLIQDPPHITFPPFKSAQEAFDAGRKLGESL